MTKARGSFPTVLKVFLWVSLAVVGFVGFVAYRGGTKRAELSSRGVTAPTQLVRRETLPATKKRKACQIAVYSFQPRSGPVIEDRTTCHAAVPAKVTYLPEDPSRHVPGRVEADFNLPAHIAKACAFVWLPIVAIFCAFLLLRTLLGRRKAQAATGPG